MLFIKGQTMEFIKGWLQIATYVLKWKLIWLTSRLGFKCGNCFHADGGTCCFAGEISTDFWCIHFRRIK